MKPTEQPGFCPAPWLSFYIDPAGDVENCCVSKNRLGNVEQVNQLDDVLIRGRGLEIQKQMLSGETVPGCAWCHNKSHTLQSRFFDIFPDRDDPLYAESGNFKLQYMDLRWSNVCNYACVYCSPTLSSTWAQELNEFHRIERGTKTKLLEYVLDNIGGLREIYMAGGEPLMMKENEKVVEALLTQNPQCHVTVNTNLSQVGNSRVFDLLTQLPNCSWLVSVEDQEERYEYIRYPGKWDDFSSNLALLSQRVGHQHVGFNMVFININALTIWDTIDWILALGFHSHSITLALYNNGTFDGPWDMKFMSKEYQHRVLERMDRDQYRDIIGWKNIKEYLESEKTVTGHGPVQMLTQLDQRRQLDSQKVFPLVYQYLDK